MNQLLDCYWIDFFYQELEVDQKQIREPTLGLLLSTKSWR